MEDAQHGDRCLICKGAVEEMMMVATHLREGDRVVALTETRRELLLAKTEDYNAQGFRVLLIATRKLDGSGNNPTLSVEDETELTIEGMLTFLDPPKESAGKAIAALRDNGVAVKVLTGDNPVVTARICLEVGIDTHDILTGTRVEAMSDAELAPEVEKRAVFARLTPLQKRVFCKRYRKMVIPLVFLEMGSTTRPRFVMRMWGFPSIAPPILLKSHQILFCWKKISWCLRKALSKGGKPLAISLNI